MTTVRWIATIGIVVLVVPVDCPAQTDDIPLYVGKKVCLECHDPVTAQRSCLVEPITEHEQAYQALSKPEAKEIAWISGVPDDPHQSRVCLSCHATAADEGSRWWADTFNIADGVQCERCHQPGSRHVDAARAEVDPRSRIRRGDMADCTACHRDRQSHREVFELGCRKEQADSLYKTPVNLATSPDGDRLYVVCEQANSLIIVKAKSGRVIQEIAVGRQPHDVAVSPDGRILYVTNRADDTLSVIEAESGKVISVVPVGDEPHGVLTDASGGLVYVLNTAEDSISVIDATDLTESKRLAAGRGPWSLALGPDGKSICVTSVLPNQTRFQEPYVSEVTVVDAGRGAIDKRPTVADANMLQGIASVPNNGVVMFTLTRTKGLVPLTRLAQGWTITHGLGVLWPDGRVDQVLLDEPAAFFPDPDDIAVSPDGRYALVTSGGTDQVAVVDVQAMLGLIGGASDRDRREVLPNHLGMSNRFVIQRIKVGRNPRGIVFSPDGRFVYVVNALDDSVAVIDAADWRVVGDIDLGGPEKITMARRGERVFHSANNAFGQQFSCRSCHPDGHVNGLTFDIEADDVGLPVDNRSLRGILDTSPFKWEGTNPTLRRQCGPRLAVFFTRLEPFTPDELDAVTRYMCTIPRPPNRYRRPDGLTLSQRRGKMVFERTTTNDGIPIPREKRCVTCHAGAYGNSPTPTNVGTTMWLDRSVESPIDLGVVGLHNPEEYGELGMYYYHDAGRSTMEFDVPHLNNIYSSPPYLHNGAAATLEEIWTRFNLWDEHGVTSDMPRRQLIDLIAYLKAF